MAFHAYLNFNGNCREAFTRYQEIFGGTFNAMAMSAVPADDGAGGADVAVEVADGVAHADLAFGDGLLMGADVPSGQYVPAQGMYVSYAAPDAAEAARVFEALAARGVVTVPLAAAFFTTAFGMCVDRFGTPWMITAADPRASWDP